MIRFYILSFIFLSQITLLSSQEDWQEHLSHDRRAYSHLGHYLVDGEIVLLMGNENTPMNTLEVIKGNKKKEQEIISEYFTFETKTTTTGVASKEVLLIKPFEYDIPGFGVYSVHGESDGFTIRDIYGDSNFDNVEFYYIEDAHLLGGPLDMKECYVDDKLYYMTDEDQIISSVDVDGSFAYHEGLNGETYQISDGTFRKLTLPLNGSIDITGYDALYNNPFKNELVVREGNSLNTYSYEDLSFVNSVILMNEPIAIQFVEGGFYYLAESDETYTLNYFSEEGADSELFYELPKTEEVAEFRIRDFEVVGEDIYFIGLWRSPLIRRFFSYVQKRTLNKEFNPIRKDIELVDATATREALSNNSYKYTYAITVRNLSSETIHNFTSYIDLNIDFLPGRYHKTDVSLELAPNTTQVIEGEFVKFAYPLNSLTFDIEGVDFGIDSNIENNSFTADVVILSIEDPSAKKYKLSPNIGSGYITLEGDKHEIETIFISDIRGHKIALSKNDLEYIDISGLPNGKYWLEVISDSKVEQHPFVKI